MKILVTGANSFVGNAIVKYALKNNVVISMARHFNGKRKRNEIRLIVNDYKDYIEKIVPCDAIVHCAWMGTSQETRIDEHIQKENYLISYNMIKKAIVNFGLKKVVLAGSQAEYGPTNGAITEETQIHPNTAYGYYKNLLFKKLKNDFPKIQIIDARIFSSYGPGQDDRNMIPFILKKMLKDEDCEFTKATQIWNYIYIDDLAKIFVKLCNLDIGSYAINLANKESLQLKEYIKIMKCCTKSKSNLLFGVKSYNSSGYISLKPNIHKLEQIIPNFKFTSFEEGITKTINYIKKELL